MRKSRGGRANGAQYERTGPNDTTTAPRHATCETANGPPPQLALGGPRAHLLTRVGLAACAGDVACAVLYDNST